MSVKRIGRLHWALLWSLGLHAVMLSLWMSLPAPQNAPAAPAVQVQLMGVKQPNRASLPSVAASPASSTPVVRTTVPAPPVLVPPQTVETATPSGSAVSEIRSAPAPAAATPAVVLDPVAVSADGLREYRVALGREASRFKQEYERNYNALERERRRGWEGRVELSLRALAQGGAPRITLARSSGHAVLDEQALELIGRAVLVTPLPGALRGQNFSLPVVLDFRLEND